MLEPDELLDDAAATDNRRDVRRAVTIAILAIAIVLMASMMLVIGGISH